MALCEVPATKNPKYNTDPGNPTEDRVFLLSSAEAKQYFSDDKSRECKPSEFAIARGINYYEGDKTCWWWLRSPGNRGINAAYVYIVGRVDMDGLDVRYASVGVRPALWLNL